VPSGFAKNVSVPLEFTPFNQGSLPDVPLINRPAVIVPALVVVIFSELSIVIAVASLESDIPVSVPPRLTLVKATSYS
jgi:hypothetical protein